MIRKYLPEDVQRQRDPRLIEGCWAIGDVMADLLERYQLQSTVPAPAALASDAVEQPMLAVTGV